MHVVELQLLQKVQAGQECDQLALVHDGVQIDDQTLYFWLVRCRRRGRPRAWCSGLPLNPGLILVVQVREFVLVVRIRELATFPQQRVAASRRTRGNELLAPAHGPEQLLRLAPRPWSRRCLASSNLLRLQAARTGRRPGPMEQHSKWNARQLAVVESKRTDLVYIEA